MTANDLPAHIVNLPCEEVTPVQPFPFKSNRILRGIKYKHYLILFPFYSEYKKCQYLYTFNLETLEWSSAELKHSPEILENSTNFTILPYLENEFVLFGCYKTSTAAQTNNLFSQMQTVAKKVAGILNAYIERGQLFLEWEDLKSYNELPYLERFSASIDDRCLYIFGGSDENGELSKRLIKYDLNTGEWKEMHLYNKFNGTEEDTPWARQGHGSFVSEAKLYIFGGEDKHSNYINDIWEIIVREPLDDDIACRKIEKNLLMQRPKIGTPSLTFGKYQYYMSQSVYQTTPPYNNFLCCDKIVEENQSYAQNFSSKKYLPFDGIPHTMELFQNYIILGFESSIYYLSLDGKPLEQSSPAMIFDSNMKSLAKSRKQKSYKEHMREYFEERPFPDVMFKVEGEEISAHRGILSVRSKYFHDLFTSDIGKEKSVIEISDLSAAAFLTLLEWLYCDSVKEMKEGVAVDLLRMGDSYFMYKLRDEAEKVFVKSLTIENILERARLAVEFNSKELEDAIVKFAAREIDELKKREELNQFPPRTLERIIKSQR